MITCLMFKRPFNVSVSDSGKFNLIVPTGEEETKVEKQSIADIPFIRYRFDKYGDEEIEFIKKMKGIFKYSAHLAEVTVSYSEGNGNTDEVLDEIKTLKESVEKLCVFVYMNTTDEWLTYLSENDALFEDVENFLYDASDIEIDQFCLRDKTTAAGAIQINNLRKKVADVVYGDDRKFKSIAICESPLTFSEEESACLTAAKARELMAIYCDDNLEQPTPSANHQCMSCCGCIKYIEITSDIQAVTSKVKSSDSGKTTKKSSGPKEKKEKKEKSSSESEESSKKKVRQGAINIRSMFF